MELPEEIENIIERKIKEYNITDLKENALNLSLKYVNQKRTGQALLKEKIEAICYSVVRMPATYAAVTMAIKQSIQKDENIESFLDVGAGTGAASFAVYDNLNVKRYMCIERENEMINLAKEFMKENDLLNKAQWLSLDIEKDKMNLSANLVISSYMLNELKEENRINVVKKLLNMTNKMLIIIEPGTPEGFDNIRKIQKYAIDNNIKILAPCTSNSYCTLPKDDWCHSTVRLQRSKLHKILKQADLPYEDEKFSYIALYKVNNEKSNLDDENSINNYRILRHPIIEKGKITFKVCKNGEITTKIITKKNKELFKTAKKKRCGDIISI